jgi:hypothetical protein
VAYFADLSEYQYHPAGIRADTRTIGWLEPKHEFEKYEPTEELLELLWSFCKVAVVQTRGIHKCEFCSPAKTVLASRKDGIRRLLGTSEIRVFTKEGAIYSAPNLVYHYVSTHHYKPPDSFIKGLERGPKPPNQEYFDKLTILKLTWNETPIQKDMNAFKFEKINGVLERVSVEIPICFDER